MMIPVMIRMRINNKIINGNVNNNDADDNDKRLSIGGIHYLLYCPCNVMQDAILTFDKYASPTSVFVLSFVQLIMRGAVIFQNEHGKSGTLNETDSTSLPIKCWLEIQ